MKQKKSLYILFFLLVVIVALTLVFEVAFDHPWDERVKMSLITIYIVYGVNLILFLPLLINKDFDEMISFLPFGWNIRRLYSIIALLVGITLAVYRLSNSCTHSHGSSPDRCHSFYPFQFRSYQECKGTLLICR